MNTKVRIYSSPSSPQYDVGRLDFDCGSHVEGGDIWFSDVKGVPDDGDYELMSQNGFLHLLINVYSQAANIENQRQFKVLRRLS